MLGYRLDLMLLKVFPSLNDSHSMTQLCEMGPPNVQGLLTTLSLENENHAPGMNSIQKNQNFRRNECKQKVGFLIFFFKFEP